MPWAPTFGTTCERWTERVAFPRVVPAAARADAVRAALADEAFALHFLEDSFAAGHIAGNWGTTTMRKGTHDYYSERGLALTTWNGEHFMGEGDAFMKPADADRAANAVRDSLAQLIDSFDGKVDLTDSDDTNYAAAESIQCLQRSAVPYSRRHARGYRPARPILMQTPVPALSVGAWRAASLPHRDLGPLWAYRRGSGAEC